MPDLLKFTLFLLLTIPALSASAQDFFCNPARGFLPFGPDSIQSLIISNISPDSILTQPAIIAADKFTLKIRLADLSPFADKKIKLSDGSNSTPQGWGINITDNISKLSILFNTSQTPDLFDVNQDNLNVNIYLNGEIIANSSFKSGYNHNGKTNLISLQRNNQQFTLLLGDKPKPNSLSFLIPNLSKSQQISIFTLPATTINIKQIQLTSSLQNAPIHPLYKQIPEIIKRDTSPLTGIWHIYDYNLDDKLLTIPDLLIIAIIPSETNFDNQTDYDIIYLSGYPQNACNTWIPGQIKGQLHATPFPDTYNVTWIDAQHKPMENAIKLSTLDQPLITIHFTPQNSNIRLRRQPITAPIPSFQQ